MQQRISTRPRLVNQPIFIQQSYTKFIQRKYCYENPLTFYANYVHKQIILSIYRCVRVCVCVMLWCSFFNWQYEMRVGRKWGWKIYQRPLITSDFFSRECHLVWRLFKLKVDRSLFLFFVVDILWKIGDIFYFAEKLCQALDLLFVFLDFKLEIIYYFKLTKIFTRNKRYFTGCPTVPWKP